MLVLTRREGEEIVIGDPRNPVAVVQVTSIKGDRVRLGVTAPVEHAIHRAEVAERVIADLNRAAEAGSRAGHGLAERTA